MSQASSTEAVHGQLAAAQGLRTAVLALLFSATGVVGLLFEQASEKLLATVIGGTTPAAAVVLAVYFCGLAAGGGLCARVSRRVSRPLLLYGVLEGAVGAWALFMRLLFEPIQLAAASLVQSTGDSGAALFAVRFGIACVWILPPTLAMGASFPLIVAALSRLDAAAEARQRLALFYSLNLLGAILGTLGGAYLLLPWGGPGAALVCSFLLECGVCAGALWLDRRVSAAGVAPAPEVRSLAGIARIDRDTAIVLLLGAASGFVFFAFEVVAVHLIGATVGTSAYAFADMLAVILLGMLVSGLLVGRVSRRRAVLPDTVLAGVLVAAALSLAFAARYWPSVSQLFLLVKPGSFAAAEAYRFLFSCSVLLPCAIALGGIYPLLFRLAWFREERRQWVSGALVAANACGCFAGSLVAAFVLLPLLGSQSTLLLASGVLALGAVALLVRRTAPTSTRIAFGFAALSSLGWAVAQPRWDWRAITTGANVHFAPSYTRPDTNLLFVHEDARGGVTTVVKNPGKPRVLLTNGKFQGDDRGQMPAQVGLALVPILHLPRADQALVIGLGTGHSAAVVADAGFRHVDIAELAPGIVAAARQVLADLNGGVLDAPNVSLHLDDGRNFLLRSRQSYDLITIEVSSVWFAGATNLYSAEFYQAARDKLAPDGVLQQWVQLHHIGIGEILATVLTLRDVFEHVELYVVGGQGILLASQQPLLVRPSVMRRVEQLPSLRAHLAVLQQQHSGGIAELPRWRLFDEQAIDALHARLPDHVRNTDMNRYLEYATPRYQVAPGRSTENLAALLALLPAQDAEKRRAALLP